MPNTRANALENETTRLGIRYTNSGAAYNPYSQESVNIYSVDPVTFPSATPIATISPSQSSTGLWYVDYTFTTPGVYYDKWRFIPFNGQATSEVVETVTVNTLPTATERDWTLVATWETELNSVREKLAKVTQQVIQTDGTLSLKYGETAKMLHKQIKDINIEIMRLNGTTIVAPTHIGRDDEG